MEAFSASLLGSNQLIVSSDMSKPDAEKQEFFGTTSSALPDEKSIPLYKTITTEEEIPPPLLIAKTCTAESHSPQPQDIKEEKPSLQEVSSNKELDVRLALTDSDKASDIAGTSSSLLAESSTDEALPGVKLEPL